MNDLNVRKDFPILDKMIGDYPLVYFDSAATTQKPHCVIDAMSDFYRHEYGTVHRAVYSLAAGATKKHFLAREKVKNFLSAKHLEEIVFTRGTTDGLNLLAYGLGKVWIQEGDEILIPQTEHHANLVPWQRICQEKKAKLVVLPIDEKGELIVEEVRKKLSKKSKILALAHITNTTGTVYPIEEIIPLAHEVGCLVVVDAAQSAAHIPIDVQALDVDFLVFSGHKIYGPTGIGVLYGKKHLLKMLPPYQMGGDMVDRVSFEATSFQNPPLRFEAGTPPIVEIIGLGAAIDYIESIGRKNIAAWEEKLLYYATDKLKEIPGIKFLGEAKNKGAIISFVVEGVHPLDLGTMMDCRGVAMRTGHLCSQTTLQYYSLPSFCRISFGVYNTHEEIDHFAVHLQEVLSVLC